MYNIMDRRLTGILIILVGLVAIAGFIYFMFFYIPAPEQPVIDQVEIEEPISGLPVERETPQVQERVIINARPQARPSVEEVGQEDLKRMAGSFAERFGSFSNQSDYGNIRDLKIFMSSNMEKWANEYIADAISKGTQTNIYYGITTKAISRSVEKFDEVAGSAKILVQTYRWESTGTGANSTSFNQNILISFIKERGAWKVDSAYWQEK